jgi:hypothetical protein
MVTDKRLEAEAQKIASQLNVYDSKNEDITILAGNYEVQNENGRTSTFVEYDKLLLPNSNLSISIDKKIIKTDIAGRNNTFKEFISNGDFKIEISGVYAQPYKINNIINPNFYFPPYEFMESFFNIALSNNNIQIENESVSRIVKINKFVVDGQPKIEKIIGCPSAVNYTITFISDVDYNLIIDKITEITVNHNFKSENVIRI